MPSSKSHVDDLIQRGIIPEWEYAPLLSSIEKLRKAGAKGHLSFVGRGASGFTILEDDRFAWKIASGRSKDKIDDWLFLMLEKEAEFLHKASLEYTFARNHVARIYSWFPEHVAIKKEMIFGRHGVWADQGHLFKLHDQLEDSMIPMGFTSPEFKEDSWVLENHTNRWVLVDAGMAHRIGKALIDYVWSVIDGRRQIHESPQDLAFDLRREVGKTISQAESDRWEDRLHKRFQFDHL